MADIELRVDRNNDGDFSDSGEDLSADVVAQSGIKVYRGNDGARAISPPRIGDMSTELNNRGGEYSPGSTVTTGRPVQVRVDSTSIWRGILERPRQRPDVEIQSTEIQAVGIASRLRGVNVSTALYQSIRVDEAIGHVLDAVDWPTLDRTLDTAQTTLAWWWLDETDAWEALLELYYSEGPGALLYEGTAGDLVFRDRRYPLTAVRATDSQTMVSSLGASPNIADGFEQDDGFEDIVNEATLTVVQRSRKSAETIWEYSETLTLSSGVSQILVARASTGDPFMNAVLPVENTDYTVTAGSVSSITLDRTSGGSTAITVTAGSSGVTITGLSLRARPVSIDGITSIANTADVSSSITANGRRTLPGKYRISPEIAPNVAQDLANAIVNLYGGGRQRVELPVINRDATTETQQLTRDMGDRLTVNAESGLYDVTQDFRIYGIAHETRGQSILHTTWSCEEITDVDYATWGAGLWGTGVWGF